MEEKRLEQRGGIGRKKKKAILPSFFQPLSRRKRKREECMSQYPDDEAKDSRRQFLSLVELRKRSRFLSWGDLAGAKRERGPTLHLAFLAKRESKMLG